MSQMTRRNLFLPDDLVAEAKKLAEKQGVPMAEVVRVALEKYLQAVRRADGAENAPG